MNGNGDVSSKRAAPNSARGKSQGTRDRVFTPARERILVRVSVMAYPQLSPSARPPDRPWSRRSGCGLRRRSVHRGPRARGLRANPKTPQQSSTRRATALPGLTATLRCSQGRPHTPWLAVGLAVAQPSPPSSTPTIISRRVVRCFRRCASESSRRPCWLGRPPRPAHFRGRERRRADSRSFTISSCAIRGSKAFNPSDSTIAGFFATISSVTTRRERLKTLIR